MIVQFNPKLVTYEVFGPAGSTAKIDYFDADANTHEIDAAPLPWSITISTTLPAVSTNIMSQADSDQDRLSYHRGRDRARGKKQRWR